MVCHVVGTNNGCIDMTFGLHSFLGKALQQKSKLQREEDMSSSTSGVLFRCIFVYRHLLGNHTRIAIKVIENKMKEKINKNSQSFI